MVLRGVTIATSTGMSFMSGNSGDALDAGAGMDDSPGQRMVFVLSSDAVAAALLGALVETLGYLVQFLRPPGAPHPPTARATSVAMVDCKDPSRLSLELLGRATIRGVSAVILGAPDAIARTRTLAREFSLSDLIVPISVDALDEPLRQAIAQAC